MVNFTKIGITQGLNYTGELASKITSLKYSIEDDLRKIEDLFSNRFTEIQGCIERCSSDVQTGRDVLAHNRTKRSEFNMEYNSARKELESLRNSETPNQEEISKYEQIKAYAEQLQNAAERMIRQLETVLSRIEMEKFKLENARDRLKKAHKRFQEKKFEIIKLLNNGEVQMKSAKSFCKQALDTINGIFTSCVIENSDVLVTYKSRLNSSIEGLNQPSVHLTQGINNVNTSVKGLPFLNVMTQQSLQASQEMLMLKKNLEDKIKELDKYIACLKKYEKI